MLKGKLQSSEYSQFRPFTLKLLDRNTLQRRVKSDERVGSFKSDSTAYPKQCGHKQTKTNKNYRNERGRADASPPYQPDNWPLSPPGGSERLRMQELQQHSKNLKFEGFI